MMNRSKWYAAGEERGTDRNEPERVPSVPEVLLNSAPDHEEGDGGEALRTLGSRIRELQHEVEHLNSAVHEEQMLRIREQATLQRDKSSFEARTKLVTRVPSKPEPSWCCFLIYLQSSIVSTSS